MNFIKATNATVCLAIVLSLFGCGRGEDSIASINGEPITKQEFYDYLEVKPAVNVRVNPVELRMGSSNNAPIQTYTGRVEGSLGFQALQDMIQRKAIMQLAKDEGVAPSQSDIVEELEKRKRDNPRYVQDMRARGLSLSMIKEDLAIALAQERIMSKGVTVTDQEVQDFIDENPNRFMEKARADLRWILVKNEDAKKDVDSDLLAGQRFVVVAERYSEATRARELQGRYHITFLDQMPPALRKLVEDSKESTVTDWIQTRDGWAKFFIEKKVDEKPLKIDDAMRDKVRRLLAMEKGSIAIDVNGRLAKKLSSSKIVIHDDKYKDAWAAVSENINKTATALDK